MACPKAMQKNRNEHQTRKLKEKFPGKYTLARYKSSERITNFSAQGSDVLHRWPPGLEFVPDIPEETMADFALPDALLEREVDRGALRPPRGNLARLQDDSFECLEHVLRAAAAT